MDKLIISIGSYNTTRIQDRFAASRIMENYPHYTGIMVNSFVFGCQLHVCFAESATISLMRVCKNNRILPVIIQGGI